MTNSTAERIPNEVLAQQWFAFIHRAIGGLQVAFRTEHKRSGLTQKDIAQKLGKHEATVSRCLSGQQNMTLRTLHNLARAMDCRMEIKFSPLAGVQPTNRATALAASQPASQFIGKASNSASPSNVLTYGLIQAGA